MKQARVAFSGSGYLAPIHAGAICAFLDAGIQIVEVAGTSGGSIAAGLIASGMSYSQIKAAALSPLPDGIISYNPIRLVTEGLNSGEILHKWLWSLFGDRTLENAIVPIAIMATDIDSRCSFRFSNKETPDVLLYDACRASASVPLVYAPFEINGKDFMDGGMCCSLPVDQLTAGGAQKFGIEVIDGSGEINTSLVGRMESCLSTMLASNEANLVAWAKQTGATIIPVSAAPYSFLDSNLPQDAKQDLFRRGYDAVTAALKGN